MKHRLVIYLVTLENIDLVSTLAVMLLLLSMAGIQFINGHGMYEDINSKETEAKGVLRTFREPRSERLLFIWFDDTNSTIKWNLHN